MSFTRLRPTISRPAPHDAHATTRGVVVLGMGRSGTSAVTRMFVCSGYFVGERSELLPEDETNPRGYFERWSVYHANEQVLARVGGTWFDVPDDLAQASLDPACIAPVRQALAAVLSAAGSSPVALKDPRIGMMLPLWWPLLDGVLHPVLVVRDPLEVALSLERRDCTAAPVGLAMWELHVVRLLAGLAGRRVTVVPYQRVLDVAGLAGRLVAEVSRELCEESRRAVDPAGAGDALDPALRRNRRSGSAAEHRLTDQQERLAALLASYATGTSVLEVPDWALRPSAQARALVAYERRRRQAFDAVLARAERAEQTLAAAAQRPAS